MVAIEVPLNPDFVGKDEIQIQARKNSSVAIGAQKVFADDTASVSDTYKVSVDPAVFTDISVVDNQGQAQTGYLVQARSSLSGAVLNQAEVKDGKFSLRGISQPYKLELISESDGKATPISVDESKRVVVGSSSLETSDVVSSATDATPINSSNIPSAVWIWVLVIIAILFLGALTFILVAKHKASKD